MSASMRTQNYDLPVYAGSDDLSVLTDFNGAMNTIDTAMNNNKTTAQNASQAANNAVQTVSSLSESIQTITNALNQMSNDISSLGNTVQLINANYTTLNGKVGVLEQKAALIRGTLVAGSDTVVLANERITPNSVLDVYTGVWGVLPTAVVCGNGSVTLTFEVQEANLEVAVKVVG